MVDHVNAQFTERTARRHGEQKHLPVVSDAVKRVVEQAGKDGTLKRADDYGEAIHKFFTEVIFAGMQENKLLQSNIKINFDGLGLKISDQEVGWVVFHISLAEFLGLDGQPIAVEKAAPEPEQIRVDPFFESSAGAQ
jgi:hypothetical protein